MVMKSEKKRERANKQMHNETDEKHRKKSLFRKSSWFSLLRASQERHTHFYVESLAATEKIYIWDI